jgi:hypothetical protein
VSKLPPRTKKYGHMGTAASLVDRIRSGIATAIGEQVLLILAGLLLPQFAFAIYAGYFAYKYGQKALSLKKDYDEMKGEPEEKLTVIAIREGFKAGVSAIGQETVSNQVGELVSRSIHTTTQSLSSSGTFERVASAIGQPDQSEVIRDFYMTSTERVLQATYDGTQDVITDYIARRVIS